MFHAVLHDIFPSCFTLSVDTSKLRVETVRKYATVSCNDPRQPNVRLNINGILRQVIKASPNALILKGPVGETLTGMFEVSMGTELGITVTEVTVNKNQADLDQIVEVVEGEKYQIHLTAPAALIAGMTRDIVNVEVVCSDGELRTTTVPLTLDHQSPITIVPRGNIVFQRKTEEKYTEWLDELRKHTYIERKTNFGG